MKIYNEVITQFNDITGQWETLYEDFEEYSGNVALAQGVPPHSTAISAQDSISDTIKTTAGYFTNGDGTLSGTDVHTGSLVDSNEKYYFNITQLDPSSSKSEVQFSVTFGDINGSGSDQYGDTPNNPTNIYGQTQAIYKQFSSILQPVTEVSGGFKISANGSSGIHGTTGARDEYIYVLIGKRARFKERINKKSWTIVLSGSKSEPLTGSGAVTLKLTDDSKDIPPISTPGGLRYNIVSGALGNVHTTAATKTYGWFYPERGVFLFSGVELSASIPGGPNFPGYGNNHVLGDISASASGPKNTHYSSSFGNLTYPAGFGLGSLVQLTSGSYTQIVKISGSAPTTDFTSVGGAGFTASAWRGTGINITGITASLAITTDNITASFDTVADINNSVRDSSSGFAPNLYSKAGSDPKNALRFINCLRNVGSSNAIQMRSEEDATQESYFCRIRSNDYNFTSNPTFISGGLNKLRHENMIGNPTTFITGLGLYNSAGQLLAIAEMSKPLKKNFVSEATIKVKLTY